MILTRHRLLAYLACLVALGVAAQASAQSTPLVQLDYNAAKALGTVDIAGGAIDVTTGAMIVTTASFGFVPEATLPGEYEVNGIGVAEYGDAAIHDALIEGANYANGYWNGTNGIISSAAANSGNFNTGVGWVDNAYDGLTSFRGVPVNASQSIISYAYIGDNQLDGSVDYTDFSTVNGNYGLTTPGFYGSSGSVLTGTVAPYNQPGGVVEPVEWIDGDVNQDGTIDYTNYSTTNGNYGLPALWTQGPVAPAGVTASISPVPEPLDAALFSIVALCGFGFRFFPKRHR